MQSLPPAQSPNIVTNNFSQKSSKPTSTSPFARLTTSLYLSLSPCANAHPLEGLCAEHLSPHLMSYYAPFNGVLLSYSNPRISTTAPEAGQSLLTTPKAPEQVLARSTAEYAVTFVWLTAEFLVFRPERGTLLTGAVNVMSESMLGLLCYNYFNVAIPREQLPKGWSWDEEQWNDVDGNPVGVGSMVKCRVNDFVASGAEGLSIDGTVVED
jgi:DNA-directed RNA polymerase I subunit RPA43